MKRAVIFDLDGTLLDTLADLGCSMNRVLADMGFPSHPIDAYRFFVGEGIYVMVKRSLPPKHRNETHVERVVTAMRKEYAEHSHDETRPYPGIFELLHELQQRGIVRAILSNKPNDFVSKMVAWFFPDHSFSAVRGTIEGEPKKPDPRSALQIAEVWSIAASDICLLGDTWTDMQTARAAGMLPVGALWGFRSAEELRENGASALIQEPAELLDILDRDGELE